MIILNQVLPKKTNHDTAQLTIYAETYVGAQTDIRGSCYLD